MIERLGEVLSRGARRFVPDPFVLALGLTAVVAVVAFAFAGEFWPVATGWAEGVANPGGLAFALQICLILVTGHALALSPPVQRAIDALARAPKSAKSASALVAFVACAAALVHWGLGAIAGALLARELGRRSGAGGIKLHYPILGAAAYAGMAVWHGGLSGSAPLKTAEGYSAKLIGTIPLSDLLLSPLNLAVTGSLIVLIPAMFYLLTPADDDRMVAPPTFDDVPEPSEPEIDGVLDSIQHAPAVGWVIGSLGLSFVVFAIAVDRLTFDINTVNLIFFFAGVAMQGSLSRYTAAVADGARGAGAIIVQFPLYFGILGLMKAGGLVGKLSTAAESAGSTGFPVLDYLLSGAVNLVVPSGGGQWAVQSEILLEAGNELGVDPVTTIMAFSYGDSWTNMLQPFWALPLLGIMGLRARHIIGYTALVFLLMLVVVPVWLLAMG